MFGGYVWREGTFGGGRCTLGGRRCTFGGGQCTCGGGRCNTFILFRYRYGASLGGTL
jgi:hypothetical protein